jgi:hypothetical protein
MGKIKAADVPENEEFGLRWSADSARTTVSRNAGGHTPASAAPLSWNPMRRALNPSSDSETNGDEGL